MKPLISILIPAYNAEKWIKYSIESALNQTWQNKEIIIVDDGSTDNTYEIAKEFESRNVKVISQANHGASAARNVAFRHAQGDYIQWLDADDLLAPNKVTAQLAGRDLNTSTKTLYSGAWGIFFYRINRARFVPSILWKDASPKDWLVRSLGVGGWMQPSTWLVSRRLAEKAGPWDERLSVNDDGEYSCRLVAASDLVQFERNAIIYYRDGVRGRLSAKRSGEAFESINLSVRLSVEHLLHLEDTSETRKACKNYINRVLAFLSPYSFDMRCDEAIKELACFLASLGGEVALIPDTHIFRTARILLGLKKTTKLKLSVWHMRSNLLRYFDGFMKCVDDFKKKMWSYSKENS